MPLSLDHEIKVKVLQEWTLLTLKAPIKTAADNIHKYFFITCFSEKIRLDISSESSARQRIHMKNQALFSLKDKSKKIKMSSAAIFVGALSVKEYKYVQWSYFTQKLERGLD